MFTWHIHNLGSVPSTSTSLLTESLPTYYIYLVLLKLRSVTTRLAPFISFYTVKSVSNYVGNRAIALDFLSNTCLCFRVNLLLTRCAAMESANMLNLF